MNRQDWDNILEKLVDTNEFASQIRSRGFYLSPEYESFRQYTEKEWNVISTTNAANFLSKDFWSQQSKVLTSRNHYLIRTGEGAFAIFDENRFPRPYLDLKTDNMIELESEEPVEYENLKTAFKENILENAALEQLRFNRVYDKLIKEITGYEQEYYIGPRGNTTRTFDVYFQTRDSQILKIFTYKGQAELDYTIWTRNAVLLFEAKKIDAESNLDIGWHKFAFPAIRFLNYQNLNIYPIYFLRWSDRIILFVFPKFRSHDGGIILNDKKQMTPEKVFSIKI